MRADLHSPVGRVSDENAAGVVDGEALGILLLVRVPSLPFRAANKEPPWPLCRFPAPPSGKQMAVTAMMLIVLTITLRLPSTHTGSPVAERPKPQPVTRDLPALPQNRSHLDVHAIMLPMDIAIFLRLLQVSPNWDRSVRHTRLCERGRLHPCSLIIV